MIARLRAIPLGAAAAVAAFLTTVSIVAAADTEWRWPPAGDSQQSAYFTGGWGIGCVYYPHPWSHSATTHIFDGGSSAGIYIYYYDVYGGYTPPGDAYWFQQWVTEQHGAHFQRRTAPPYNYFWDDYTEWWNMWFHYTLQGVNVFVTTKFWGPGDSTACPATSHMVFAH